MKIHYTSGHFYIEKDGKKIKISNPGLLPISMVQREDGTWKCAHRDGDTLDVEWVSVEIKGLCKCDLKPEGWAILSTCPCFGPEEFVAILSKSSSQNSKSDSVISNNSEKPDFEDIAEKHFESKGLWYGELNTWERAI